MVQNGAYVEGPASSSFIEEAPFPNMYKSKILVMNLKGTKARNDCTGEYEHDLTD
jgi:hypothetical protein